MPLLDSLYQLSGVARKRKSDRLQEVARSLTAIESWIEEYAMGGVILENTQKTKKTASVLERGFALVQRLINRLENNYSEGVMNDTITAVKSLLVLNVDLAREAGAKMEDFNNTHDLPDLHELLLEDENILTHKSKEAINAVTRLYKKYPY